MRRHLLVWSVLVLCGILLSAGAMDAQETPPTPTGAAPPRPAGPPRADETPLIFDREVFSYPLGSRRDPFLPLLSQDESGPRFEEIQLIGVLFHPNPDLSLATFGPKGGGTGSSYRARRGDRLGNIRILEIQLTRVIVSVDEFGETTQHIMELQRPGQGGL